MKAFLKDGTVIQGRPTSASMCTGFKAERIEMERGDFECLLKLQLQSPSQFRAVMLQLDARFPINGQGDKK